MVGLKELDQFDYGVQYQRGQPSTTQVSGIAGLASPASLNIAGSTQNALADMRSLGEMPTIQPPPPPSTSAQANKPVLAISRSTGKIWANGKLFTTDDAQGALESEQFVGGAPVPAPAAEATDWEPLSEEAYAQHLGKIKNPSLTTLAAKNFGTGIDTSQMLAGYGLQFLGATETGQGIVRQQLEDIRKNAPYQRSLEDVPERGVMEWFVANLAQQGPNLIESAVTAAIGAGVGALAGGGPNPFTAAGGAITSMVGKQAFKQAVLAAAKKYTAGEVLDAAESKLLREAAGITVAARKELFDKIGTVAVNKAGQATIYTADDAAKALLGPAAARAAAAGAAQAQVGGAAIATGLQNYATGVADLFGESVEGGQPDRLMAALGAVPYAAAESIPEYLAALRLFKGLGLKAAKAGARGGRAGAIATNVGIGTGAGAILEGTTETLQETLGIGMNPEVDLNSPEGVSRLLNSFAAGAAIGGFIGGASSLNTGKATDVLSGGTKPAEPKAPPALSGEIIPPGGPRPVPTPDGSVPRLAAPTTGALPPPPATGGYSPTPEGGTFYAGYSQGQPPPTGAPVAPVTPGLPPATTIYGEAPAPTPALTGPAPQPAVAPPPAVIPMGGPEQYGSALSQVAAGGLPQAAPQGPFANRLLQQQATAAEQARQAQLQATSGSALARIGRGEAVGMAPPAAAPQQLELPLPAGRQKLTRGKKGQPNAAQAGQVEQGGQQQYPQDRTRVGGRRVNRNVPPQVQEAGRPAGGRNRLVKGAAPAQVQEAAAVSTAPVHDKFIADFDDARLNDANKVKLRALVKRAQAAGVLTDKDVKELDIAFKDRDQTADDIAPLASSMIENNKPKAATQQVAAPKPAPTPAKERQRAPKFNLKPEAPPPKAEGAAAAPAQKAEKVSADILRDAGWTASEISDYQRNGTGAERAAQAARGYTWIAGEYRAVTKKDIEDARAGAEQYRTERLPKLREFVRNKFAEARAKRRDFGPDGKLANVPYSDGPAVTEAEALRMIEDDFALRTVPKLERVYALTDEAKIAPSTALTVVPENQHFIEPELEAKIKREQVDIAETERLATQGDKGEVDDLIVALNTLDPADVDYRDALSALLGFAKDSSVNKDVRKKAQDYLENEVEPEAIKLAERSVMEPVSQAELDRSTIVTAMEQFNNGEITLTQRIVGVLVSAWKRIKGLDLTYGDRPLTDFIKGGPQFFNIEKGKVVPKGQGRYSTTMWDVAENPMNVGQIRLKIGKFVSGFASKPKVYVFRNQADLKASDPKLYARAAAGRPGDFDTVLAAGYSLGNEIIVFSDRIGGDQHLAFVLAHETLGHFGLRGLMGGADFDRVMTGLYDTDSRLKAGVDAAMAVRGLGKAEAVEEYLSDYAAQLHTSLVRRVWKGIKGALNRVGIKFGDEATRYLLSQAKRYVKTGEATGAFNTSSVLHRLWGVENGQVGRFSTVDAANENERLADFIRHTNAVPRDLKSAGKILGDAATSWDKFKEKVFSLSNYQALRNPGLYAFEKLLDETRQREQYVYNKYNAKLESLLYKSENHRSRVSRMLLGARTVAVYRLLEKPLSLAERNKALFSLDNNGNLIADVRAVDEFIKRGMLTFEEMRDGVEYTREIMSPDGTMERRTEKFPGFADLTQEQYDDYVLSRQTIGEVEMELLEAKYANMLHTEGVSKKAVRKLVKNGKLDGDAEKLVDKTLNKYKEIYVSGYTVDARGNIAPGREEIDRADEFLAAVNRALISADAKNDPDVRAFFENQKDADDFMTSLEDFRDKRKVPDGELTFLFQNEIKRIILDDVSLGVEEERAKRTMAGGYVPVIRDKAFEMRLQAYDENGNPVRLHENHRALLNYSQFDNASMASNAADVLNAELDGQTMDVMVQQDDGSYAQQTVTVRAEFGEALSQVSADPALNLDEFMHGLRLFKINLTPDKMSLVIRTLTEAGDQLRKRMEFSNTPGYNKDSGVFAMARHIQMRAATIAKTITRPRMRELMDRNNSESLSLWTGDLAGVFSTYNRWNAATNPEEKQHYRHQLDHKLFMFAETYPGAKGWDGSKANYDKLKADGKLQEYNYNRFYNSAQSTLDFLDNSRFVTESNFGVGRVASSLRAATSIFQLGGSIAQGVMNMISPYTNWLPYMASYNSRNGFGGGFSVGQVMAAYQVALNQVGLTGIVGNKYNTAEYYEGLLNDPAALAKSNLTQEEAAFLALEIREGKLIPAQSNALLGTARTGITNRWMLRGVDAFMLPFNRTEQASRRAAGLAAFRLAMKRNGGDVTAARDFAIQSLDLTLGEYSVLNRPPVWRDGIQSFLYMYKVYPTTTIQLMRRLDKKGQIIMLGTLWLFAGVTGFPFAEDIEDLVDTIAQALGLQMGSVRAEFVKILEGIAPGVSPYVLKGAVNTALGIPADVASRFSQGDFIPGSGLLLAGSTIGEEVKDILGPMPAMALGAATFTRDMAAAPFSEGQTFVDALRASPITLGRMFGDTYAYMANGAIVDRRGYVVSPDMTIGTLATRLMGFYPKAAAEQYDAIRIAKRVSNYQKEIVAGYRTAWVQAMLTGDRAYARQIEQSVIEWNRAAKGTQLEVSNFLKNSQRALKEAKRSAVERTLKSTSKAGRVEASRLMDQMIE